MMSKNFQHLRFFIFTIFIGLSLLACSQQQKLSTKNKHAISAYQKGLSYYNGYEYSKAEEFFHKAIEADKKFLEAIQMLGAVYEETKQYEKAISQYERVVALNSDFFPGNLMLIGNLSMKTGNYSKALQYYTQFSKRQDILIAVQQQVSDKIKQANNAIKLVSNPVPFNPVNLGANINTSNAEYSPTLTADEQTLYFTVLRPRDTYTLCDNCKEEEDFYISKKANGLWSVGKPLGHPVNSHGNEGAACISPDGMVFYFTACNRGDGFGSCDLYYSVKEKGSWSTPVNIGKPVNSGKWDSQPSIAPDGKTLYFSSAREGNMDIYVTVKDTAGNWSVPVSLGEPVNTAKSEMSPFIHPDGKTLYFTSDGHVGLGGSDIFFSRKQDDNSWSNPENIGYPINTFDDEGFFIVNSAGNTGYFASDKLGGFGKLDLFSFEMPEHAKPEPVTYLKGTVLDIETKKKLRADFEVLDLETGKTIVSSTSDETEGTFIVSLPLNKNLALHANCNGYLFYSEHFSLDPKTNENQSFEKNILMQPMKTGEIVVLRNIFFDFNKDILKPESFPELNKLTELLRKNPGMEIEISGHTDNVGSEQYNKVLSEKRALSVYNYLVELGINKSRLSYKGYGASMPIESNETDAGRATNRRTEFKVVKF